MVQAIKNNILLVVAVVAVAFAAVLVPTTASAQSVDIGNSVQCGTGFELRSDGSTCTPVVGNADTDIQTLIRRIINIFSVIVGAIAVIMIIVGGFKYITSGGDSSNISSAKNTILYAIVGLVIVAIAQAIVQFVLNTTG